MWCEFVPGYSFYTFPGGSVVKNLPANAGNTGDTDSVPGLGRSLGEGDSSPLQYSCLENSMDRGAWGATVHGVAQSQIQLSTHACPTILFFFLSNLQVSALLLKNKVLDRDATSGCWEWGLDQVCFLIHCERVSVETPQYFCSAHWWYVYLILPVDAGIAVFFWCGDLKVSLLVIKTFFF